MYHSHPATRQDEWIVKKSRGKRDGYFVEIGAYDGLTHSNTLTLERDYGWKGLLVEPNPFVLDRLVANRPNTPRVQEVIAGKECRMAFALGDQYSGLWGYMPNDWRVEHDRRGNMVMDYETITLRRLLERHDCPKVIDYLSLDVEGAEYAILETYMRCPTHHFRYLTVEFRYDALLLSKLENLLIDYKLDEVRGFDACFVNKRYFEEA